MRSSSASDRASRASRATWRTSSGEIRGSGTSDLLEMRVLERQALAAHAREVHGGDDVLALALYPHQEALAPSGVAQARAHLEGQALVDLRRRGRGGPRGHARRARPAVEERDLLFGDLQEEAR